MFDRFIELVNKHGKLEDTEIRYLQEHVKIGFYKKNETILSAGKIVRNIYFVMDGCVRLFYNVDGKDKTAFFYNKEDFIWAGKNGKHEVPTQKNYEAIEDTVLVQIDKRIAYNLMESSPNFELITRLGKEQELIAYQQLIAYFITLSPEERFIKLLETNKSLFQRVPQQYLASYLGISPETLSRIKKRVYIKSRKYILDDRQEFLRMH